MNISGKIILMFGLFVAVFILFFGIVLLFTNLFIERIPKPNRNYLGVVFILYSFFRIYRANKQYKKIKSNS